jgi:hypothetical protein
MFLTLTSFHILLEEESAPYPDVSVALGFPLDMLPS